MPIQTGAILPRGAPSEDDDKLDWTDRVMRRWQRNPPNPQGGGDFPDASEEGMHSHDLLQGSNPREVISPDTEQPSSGIIRASGKAASADGFSFDEALKPAGDAGFSFDDALKPAQKPSAKDDGLPWDVPMTGAQMRQSQEQIRKGEEKISANEPEPGLEHLLTGPVRIAQRGGQQLLGERPLPTGVEALEEASLGVRPSKFTSATAAAGTSAPRIEPTVPGGGGPRLALPAPKGFTLEEAGITPTPEPTIPPRLRRASGDGPKPGGATLEEAGIRPTPEPPAPATETETVAVPQADGTVKQVQVQTGEPPPPGEPPASTTGEARVGPMNPADLRAGFPDLSDEQFEALFQQANREVPRSTSIDPADQGAWMKAVMGTMARLSGSSTSTTAPAADPWAPVTVAPSDQPDAEIPIPQTSPASAAAPETQQPASAAAPEAQKPTPPEEVPASDLKPGDRVMLGDVEHEVEAVRPWTGDQVGVKLKDDPKLHIGPADAPVRKAPSSEAALAAEPIPVPLTNLEGIHNGPWTAVGKNYIGDTVFENASGVRAIMDGNVPYTESSTEHPEKGRVPKNAGDRKRQFLIEGEKWADEKPSPESTPAAQPSASKPKVAIPKPESVPETGQIRPESGSIQAEAHPESTPAEVPIDEPPDELRGALNTLSGGRTHQTPTGEVPPAEEPPEELQGQSTGYKPRREYNKYLTNQAEIAANKLIVDALNGDIPEKNAIAGLGELVRRGGLSEGAARVNLSRLNDWNEGEWEAAKSVPAENPSADLTGIPKTAYRGTGRTNVASVYNGVAEPIAGAGRYSAFSKSDAEMFGPNVEEAPIDLKNPLIIRSDPEWRALTKEAGWEFPNPYGMTADKFKVAAAKLKGVVQSKGHDGIIAWWNNDTPHDVDDKGRSIKTLRNALGVPQVIDYREPQVVTEEAPKVDEPVAQMKKRDIWYVDHATPEELIRILGDNWVIARDTPANRKRHSEDAKFISRKTYNEAQAQVLAERKDKP